MEKKLQRNKEKALLGGVIAGLADYFGQDVLLFRLVAIVLLIITGLMPGALIYAIAWVVIPVGAATEPVRDADYTVHE